MNIINIIRSGTPTMFDKVADAVNAQLKNDIAWIDQCFGRSEVISLPKQGNGTKAYKIPAIFTGARPNDYQDLSPSNDLGNYTFFVLRDPMRVEEKYKYRIPFSLIMWVDVRRCSSNPLVDYVRDTESIKMAVIESVNNRAWISGGSVYIDQVYESAANVWKGYTMKETENQYNMQPYASFRFDGEAVLIKSCTNTTL